MGASISWKDQGVYGDWIPKMITFDSENALWGVGTAGNFGKWHSSGQGNQGHWDDMGGNWALNSILFVGQDLWGVGAAGNVGKWNGSAWVDHGQPGFWTLQMLAQASPTSFWGVGIPSGSSAPHYALAAWQPDLFGGTWNPIHGAKPGYPGGWNVIWGTFQPKSGSIYCVGEQNNLGIYDPTGFQMTGVTQSWSLIMVTFDNQGTIWGVNKQGHIGVGTISTDR